MGILWMSFISVFTYTNICCFFCLLYIYNTYVYIFILCCISTFSWSNGGDMHICLCIQLTLDITDDVGTGICHYIQKSQGSIISDGNTQQPLYNRWKSVILRVCPLYLMEITNTTTIKDENLDLMDENLDMTDENSL